MHLASTGRRCIAVAGTLIAVIALTVAQLVPAQASSPLVVIGARNFAEEQIAGYLYGDVLSAHGITVSVQEGFGTEDSIFTALKSGSINVDPDYLGNGLVDLNKIYRVGHSPTHVQATINKAFKPFKIKLLTPSPKFNDPNVFVTTKAVSKKYGLKTFSDLARLAPKLRIEVLHECTIRPDCLLGFNKIYHPKAFKGYADPVSATDQSNQPFYDDLLNRKFDVVQGYGATDPQIPKYHLIRLIDNKHVFPPDNMTPFVSTTLLKGHPAIAKWFNKVSAALTTANYTKMDALAYGGEQPQQVADNFLMAHHLM